ncbi:C1q-like domain-containing protein [Larkinella sp. GY13]|uniref:C1q-like domain-containing protein n=1 Tax=Larkinella sp. GY13 TaxID=3453720 RepID=UPI003EE9AE92
MKTSINQMLAVLALLICTLTAQAQVKIGNNPTSINGGSLLELEGTDKALLMPRISLTNTTTWGLAGTPAAGMHVYNTNVGITSTNAKYPTLEAFIGEYYWDGTGWVALGGSQSADVVLRVEFAGSQTVTTGVTVNFNSTKFDKGAHFSLATDKFTAPSAGFYLVNFNINCGIPELLGYATGRYAHLVVNGTSDRILFNDAVGAGAGFARTTPALLKLNAGDTVWITAGDAAGGGAGGWRFGTAILEITKLSN